MIRKVIIATLTLAAVWSASVWIDSYRSVGVGRRWFLGPFVFADAGECDFRGELDHMPHKGWHLWYGDLGENGNRYVCLLASRGFIVVRQVTHSTPDLSLPPGTTGPIHKAIGGFEFQTWGGVVAQGPQRGGYQALRCRFPIWSAVALFAAYPTLAFIRGPIRRWRRRRKNLCVKCAYNLTGNVSGTCPECGTEINKP